MTSVLLPATRRIPGGISRRFKPTPNESEIRTFATTTLFADLPEATFVFWIKANAVSKKFLVSDDNDGSHGWFIQVNSTGRLELVLPRASSDLKRTSTNTINSGAFVHGIVRMFAGASPDVTKCDFVINGVVDAGTATATGSGTHNTGTAYHLTMGGDNIGGSGSAFDGSLAHVAIFNRRVSDGEARALYRGELSPLDLAGCVGYWPMDGCGTTGFEPNINGNGFDMFALRSAAAGNLGALWDAAPPLTVNRPRRARYVIVPAGGSTTFPLSVGGAISPAATLVKSVLRTLTGAESPAGSVAKQVQRPLSAAIAPAGALVKQLQRGLTAAIGPVGTLAKQVQRRFTASVSSAGALSLTKVILITLTGALSPSGSLRRQTGKALSAAVAVAGTLTRSVSRAFSAAIALAGSVANQNPSLIQYLIVGPLRNVLPAIRMRDRRPDVRARDARPDATTREPKP